MSAWISPSLTTDALSDGAGTYNYRYETTFDLTGLNPASARLAGRWSTDNGGVDIFINGISTGQANTAQFVAWTPFQITSGFVAGTNRIAFVVNNGGPGAVPGSDPTGLRVEIWGSALLDCSPGSSSPRISIARQSGNVIISWHQPGFLLQTAINVTGPWLDLTRGASVNGRDYAVVLSASGSRRFFRLRLDCE